MSAGPRTAAALIALAWGAPTPAQAQFAETPEGSAVIARVCAGRAHQTVTELQLAEGLLIEASILPSDFARRAAGPAPRPDYARDVVAGMRRVAAGGSDLDRDDQLRSGLDLLQLEVE